jgi:hypothetical protein
VQLPSYDRRRSLASATDAWMTPRRGRSRAPMSIRTQRPPQPFHQTNGESRRAPVPSRWRCRPQLGPRASADPTIHTRPSSASKTTGAASEARFGSCANGCLKPPKRPSAWCLRPCEGREELALARRPREVYDGGRDRRRGPRQAKQRRRPNARCEPELAPITVRGRALKPMHVGTV